MKDIEASLTRQIADIDQQIDDLQNERRALERLLLKTRRANVAHREVGRANSITRILVEDQIIETLRNATKPMSAPDLYSFVLDVVSDLKSTTFRSHLKRMKDRGVIKQLKGHGGAWFLPIE